MTYEESKRIRAISTMFQGGKIQVPSEVRRSLGVKDGDKLLWIMYEGKWVVERS